MPAIHPPTTHENIALTGSAGGVLAGTYPNPTFGSDKVNFYNVKDYGAVGDGIVDDTSAINTAMSTIPQGSTLWFPSGTYLVTNLTCSRSIFLLGGSTIGLYGTTIKAKSGATGTILTFSGGSDQGLQGIRIDLTLTPTANGLKFDACNRPVVNLVRIIEGFDGLTVVGASQNGIFYKVIIEHPANRGVFVNYDDGAEHTFEDCVIWLEKEGLTPLAGMDFERTTPDDSGGIYINRCRINRGPTYDSWQYGVRVKSTAGTRTQAYLLFQHLIIDKFDDPTGAALWLENVSHMWINDCFFGVIDTQTTNAINLKSANRLSLQDNVIFGSINVESTTAVTSKVLINGNTMGPTGTRAAIILPATNKPTGFTIGLNQLWDSAVLVNDATYFNNISDSTASMAGLTVLGHGSGNKHSNLSLGDITSAKWKTFRTNSSGDLEIVNNAYTDTIFRVTDAGQIILGSASNPSRLINGSGAPEGVVSAPVGSLYLRTDGGTNTTFYIKESGSGNTGWVAK